MDLVGLTEYLVKSIVKEPDTVSVKEFEEGVIQVLVKQEDMGAVIGKSGMTANAIRTVVQAAAYANDLSRVRVNIDSY